LLPDVFPVTVVVPLYDAGPYVERLGLSLRGQRAAEVIVVIDDMSDPQDIRAALAMPNLVVLRTRGGIGTAGARNLGARDATSQWVTFLDQDDWWPSGFLAALCASVEDYDAVAYDNLLWRDADDGPVPIGETVFERAAWTEPVVDAATSARLLADFPMLKVLLKTAVFRATGGYRSIYGVEDFDLVWRLIASGVVVRTLGYPRGNYLLNRNSTTVHIARDGAAWKSAQRSWIRVWFGMARARALPYRVRVASLRNALFVALRLTAVDMRRRVRRAP
jgi:glycosyltransferase involved in cell wall biosynthesis